MGRNACVVNPESVSFKIVMIDCYMEASKNSSARLLASVCLVINGTVLA